MLASLTATSMPQTGSMAVSVERATGAGSADVGSGASLRRRLHADCAQPRNLARLAFGPQRDDLREDRQRDLLRGLRADLEAGRRLQPSALLIREIERLAHGLPADLAGDQGHVRNPRSERLGEHPLLIVTVRRHDDRGVIGPGPGLLCRAGLDGISHPPRQVRQGGRDRRDTDDSHGGRREMRLQEDLERAAAEAGVLDGHRPLIGLRFPLRGGRQDPKQQGVAGFHRAKRVEADRGLRAGAPDEALDRAVGTHDRRVTGPDAGRALRPHHRRRYERGLHIPRSKGTPAPLPAWAYPAACTAPTR